MVTDKVKVQQYKVHNLIKMDNMCALKVGESSHFTSSSAIVSTTHCMDLQIIANTMHNSE